MASPYTATANTKMLLRFDSTSSTPDATGNVTDLTGGTGNYTDGKFSRATYQNLGSIYRTGATKSFVQSIGDYTISMWVKPIVQPSNPAYPRWTLFRNAYSTDDHHIEYSYNNDGFYRIHYKRTRYLPGVYNNVVAVGVTQIYTLPIDSYTNLIFTYDDSENMIKLYVNGVLYTQSNQSVYSTYAWSSLWNSGTINSMNGFSRGQMIYDDLVLENTVWSPEKAAFVAGAPFITAHPQPVTKDPGDTVTFSVIAIGDDLTYQWQVSENNGTFNNVPGETSSTLSFVASFPLSYNRYRVAVSTDTATIYSDSALLKVNYTAASGMLAWFHFDEGYIGGHRVDVLGPFGDYNLSDWPFENPALAGFTGFNWASPKPHDSGYILGMPGCRAEPAANIGGSLDFRGYTGSSAGYSGIAGPYNYIRTGGRYFMYEDREDYVDLDTNSFTIMTWIRLPWESINKSFDYLDYLGVSRTRTGFTYQYAGQGDFADSRWGMEIQGSISTPRIEYRFGNGTFAQNKYYRLTNLNLMGFLDGEWHHVVSVVNRVNNTITTYFDGVAHSQILDISDLTYNLTVPYSSVDTDHRYQIMGGGEYNSTDFTALPGSFSDDYKQYMSVDDHRLYKRALEPNEIKGIYDSTSFGFDFWADDRSVPVNTPIVFTPTGVFDFGVSGYNWTYGDGSVSTGYTGYHSYTGNNSSYDVSLLMQFDTGSTGLEYKVDYIRVEDVITYTINDQYYYNGESVTFTGGATGVPGPITYKWQKEE